MCRGWALAGYAWGQSNGMLLISQDLSLIPQDQYVSILVNPVSDGADEVAHTVGVGVDLVGEVGVELAVQELVEVADAPVVQLEHLVGSAQHALRVLLRVAVEEDVVAAARVTVVAIFQVRVPPDLLLPAVPAYRPDPVVLARRARSFVPLPPRLRIQLHLPPPHHVLQRVHRGEVELPGVRPGAAPHPVLVHARLGLLVVGGDGERVFVDPLSEQLVVGLRDDEVVLVGSEVLPLGVGPRVELPLERLPVVRVEEHEHARQLPVAVEDVLGGVLSDVEDPLQGLQRDEGDVHVDPAVLIDDGLAHEVGLGLREGGDLAVLDDLVEAVVGFLADVVHDVAVVHLAHLEPRRLRAPPQVLNAQPVPDARPLEPRVPEQPHDLRQRVPPLRSRVHHRPLHLLLQRPRVLLPPQQEEPGDERLRVDGLLPPLLVEQPFQLLADLLLEDHVTDVAQGTGGLLQLGQPVVGEVAVDLLFEIAVEDVGDLGDEKPACGQQYLWLMVKTPQSSTAKRLTLLLSGNDLEISNCLTWSTMCAAIVKARDIRSCLETFPICKSKAEIIDSRYFWLRINRLYSSSTLSRNSPSFTPTRKLLFIPGKRTMNRSQSLVACSLLTGSTIDPALMSKKPKYCGLACLLPRLTQGFLAISEIQVKSSVRRRSLAMSTPPFSCKTDRPISSSLSYSNSSSSFPLSLRTLSSISPMLFCRYSDTHWWQLRALIRFTVKQLNSAKCRMFCRLSFSKNVSLPFYYAYIHTCLGTLKDSLPASSEGTGDF